MVFPKCFDDFFPMVFLWFPLCFPGVFHFFSIFHMVFHAFPAGKMADETETADMRGKAIRVHLGVEGQSVRVGLRGS